MGFSSKYEKFVMLMLLINCFRKWSDVLLLRSKFDRRVYISSKIVFTKSILVRSTFMIFAVNVIYHTCREIHRNRKAAPVHVPMSETNFIFQLLKNFLEMFHLRPLNTNIQFEFCHFEVRLYNICTSPDYLWFNKTSLRFCWYKNVLQCSLFNWPIFYRVSSSLLRKVMLFK